MLFFSYCNSSSQSFEQRREPKHCFQTENFYESLGTMVEILGAIHSTKISGNFGPKLNGSVRSNRKSFEKTGPLFEVILFSRSDRLEFWLNGSRSLSFIFTYICNLFIKLVRENNKTFKKHFTRKEAHVVSFTVLDMLKIFASLLNIDVNECTAFPNVCGANTDCNNTDGSYTCICKAGYTGDGKTCSGKDLFYLKLIVFTISETFLVH